MCQSLTVFIVYVELIWEVGVAAFGSHGTHRLATRNPATMTSITCNYPVSCMLTIMRLLTNYFLILLLFFMNTGGLCDVWEDVQPASDLYPFHVTASQDTNPDSDPITDDCGDHCLFQHQCQCHGNMMGNAPTSTELFQPISDSLFSLNSQFLFSFEQAPPTRPPDV